ncbi:MAG: DUF3021 domain-containing protein [Tissierellia bacterium]|nr:DUF3021 domain-containing protein [Tissierellia bacterium]
MNNLYKKIYTGFTTGIFIGLILSFIFSYFFSNGKSYYPGPVYFVERYDNLFTPMLISVIVWGLIGLVSTLAGKIFDLDNLNLIKATIIHFLVTLTSILSIFFISGYMKFTLMEIFILFCQFLVIYFIIWLISYNYQKSLIKKINQKINEKK